MLAPGLKKIVEASYRLSGARSAWLAGLRRATEDAFGQGRGTVSALIDATDVRRTRIVEYASTRQIANLDRLLEETVATLDPAYVEDAKRAGACLATEEDGMEQRGLQMFMIAFGARDLLTVLAMDATGHGAIIATNLRVRVGGVRAVAMNRSGTNVVALFHDHLLQNARHQVARSGRRSSCRQSHYRLILRPPKDRE